MTQSIQQAASVKDHNWAPPLVCICGLCECGAHKCSDFNDWLAARDNGSKTPPEEAKQMADEQQPIISCGHSHSCSYTQPAPLDERYLTTDRQQHLSRPAESSRCAMSTGQELRNADDLPDRDRVLHVLVTRPQVATRPGDNIIFEGDMDLRTTFETSYEALARTRLEQWKRHQELRARRPATGQDVSDKPDGRAASISRNAGGSHEQRWTSMGKGALNSLDDVNVDAREGSGADTSSSDVIERLAVKQSRAAMIRPPSRSRSAAASNTDQSALSKQLRRPLVFGPALSLERGAGSQSSTTPTNSAAAAAAVRQQLSAAAEEAEQRQQDHFIDPDLSPIIVYDANLNRLERVGLRKRSKYRPSTSLRPGGRGFFGPVEGDDELTSQLQEPAHKQIRATDEVDYQKQGANLTAEPNDQISPAVANQKRAPALGAGASGETLNRDQNNCGRKHHLAHVNRVDHIKQMSLIESSRSGAKEFADSATSTSGGDLQMPARQQAHGDILAEIEHETADANENERRLAQEEEEAVNAEIQRLVVNDDEQQQQATHRNQSRQSNRLVKQTTIAGPPAANANPTPTRLGAQTNSPGLSQNGKSSRQSRMERVCQNQSFYLFDNDYPETRGGEQDDKRCIKIGARETVELSRPASRQKNFQSAHVRKNLFRESPDFIMTTGHMRQSSHTVGAQIDQNQQKSEIVLENGVSVEPTGQEDQSRAETIGREELDHWGSSPKSESHKCRVLDLTHDYEFVGSRLGHKYFVEKHVIRTPISEMG